MTNKNFYAAPQKALNMFTNYIHIRSINNNYYVYDLFHQSLHISNPVIYYLAEYCRVKNKKPANLTLSEKKQSAKVLNLSLSEINRNIRLSEELFPLHNEVKFKPLPFKKITEENILETVANVSHITIEVTEKCNLACYYCCHRDFYNPSAHLRQNDIDLELCLKALETIIGLQKSVLNHAVRKEFSLSFYGGEGLVNFEAIRRIVEFCRPFCSDNFQIKYRMTTNGVLLNKYMDFLVEHDFMLNISLDGNEWNNSYRVYKDGSPSFHIVYRNICYLREKYPDFFEHQVSFMTVEHNRNNLLSIHSFFRQFDKIPTVSSVNDEGISDKYKKDFEELSYSPPLSTEQVEKLKSDMPEAYNKYFASEKQLITSYLFSPFKLNDLFKNSLECDNGVTSTCFLFKTKVFIAVSGKIYLCEKSTWDFPFGEITSEGLHFDVKKINVYYRKLFKQTNLHCLDCYKMQNCKICYFHKPSKFTRCAECKMSYEQLVTRLTTLINQNESL